MKKTVSLILALIFVLSAGAASFAQTLGDGGTQNIDVNAKYVDSVTGGTVYSVDVTWESMDFTYTVSGSKVWKPETHSYEITTSNAWSTTGGKVTVKNHSNAAIAAEFRFEALTGFETVSGTFSATELRIDSAENMAFDAAELSKQTELSLSGSLDKTVDTLTKVGTVTVTIKGE